MKSIPKKNISYPNGNYGSWCRLLQINRASAITSTLYSVSVKILYSV